MPINNQSVPVLVGQGGNYNAHRWVIQDNLIIGRTEPCDIAIPNRQVSRHHAQITKSGKYVVLEDLGSKNGTFHNGEKVKDPIRLEDGDVIQVALAQKFIYLSQDATIPLAADDFRSVSIPDSAQKLQLDRDARRTWINEVEITPPLSALQFKLLEVLSEHEGQVLSRDKIITQVWGEIESAGVTDQALDALVRRLRRRLTQVDPDHEYVRTIRGQGFRLDNPVN
ncbi:MAG: Transcriptional regulatory protein BaeR [Chloroflexi bacterium]|nr:Transcriptional regulatory protein BaeR [Chloroflexota bacterium]